MKEKMSYIILVIALIALALSIIAFVYSAKEDSDNINVKEEVFRDCKLVSGPIPDTSYDASSCEDRCTRSLLSGNECVFGILINGDQHSFIGCQDSLNDYYKEYRCLCC